MDIFKSYRGLDDAELEVRLGSCENGSFMSGLEPELFEKMPQTLSSFKGWSNVPAQAIVVDQFTDQERVRTVDGKFNQCIKKTRVESQEFPVLHMMVRLSVSHEKQTDVTQKPIIHTRAKKTTSFITHSGWSYDCSVISDGKNMAEALKKLDDGIDLKYEVEIELKDQSLLKRTDRCLLHSLLLKVSDLIHFSSSRNEIGSGTQ